MKPVSSLCVKVPCASLWTGQGGGVLQGSMLNHLILITLFVSNGMIFYIICKQRPVLQTHANLGTIKTVVCETERS